VNRKVHPPFFPFSKEHHCFLFAQEADQFGASAISTRDLAVVFRSAYDNSRWGTERKTADSANYTVEKVMLNVSMTGTYDAFDRFFANPADGSVQRFCIGIMPNNRFDPYVPLPPRTDKQKELINSIATKLMTFHGEVQLPKLQQRAYDWLNRTLEKAKEAKDEDFASLRMRVWINAMRVVTCVLLCDYAAKLCKAQEPFNQGRFERDFHKTLKNRHLDLFDIVADYLLCTQYRFLYNQIQKVRKESTVEQTQAQVRSENQVIYDQLPKVFTTSMLVKIKGSTRKASNLLTQWKNNGLIQQQERGRWGKV